MQKNKKLDKIRFLIKNNYKLDIIDFASREDLRYNGNYKALPWVAREYKKIIGNKMQEEDLINKINIILNWYNCVKGINLDILNFDLAHFYAMEWEENIIVKIFYRDHSHTNINDEYIVFSHSKNYVIKIDFTGDYSLRDRKNYHHGYIRLDGLTLDTMSTNDKYFELCFKWLDFIRNAQFVLNLMEIKSCDLKCKCNLIINQNKYLPNYKKKINKSDFSQDIVLYDSTKLKKKYEIEGIIDIEKLEILSRWYQGRDEMPFKDDDEKIEFKNLLDFLEYQQNLQNHPKLPFKKKYSRYHS